MTELRIATEQEIEDLGYSAEYSEYIMENCGGDRIICNGDTLIGAMEDNYLLDAFLESLGLQLP